MKLLPVTVTPACANSAKSDACWQCPHTGISPRIFVRFSCTTANVCRLCFWRAHTHLQSRSTPRPRFVLRQRPLYLFVPSSLLFPWFGFCSCCCKWVRVNVWTQERASRREQAGVAADDSARLRHRNSAGRPFAGVAWPWPLKASSPAHPCKQFAVCPSQQPAHPTSPPCCHHRLYRQLPPRPPERSSRAAGAWRSLWTSAPSRQTLEHVPSSTSSFPAFLHWPRQHDGGRGQQEGRGRVGGSVAGRWWR